MGIAHILSPARPTRHSRAAPSSPGGGKLNCTHCAGHGKVQCSTCAGSGTVVSFDLLTVQFRVAGPSEVVNTTQILERQLKEADGVLLVDDREAN
jgi:hypothetical protein